MGEIRKIEEATENKEEEKQPKRKNLRERLADFLMSHETKITLNEKDKEKYVSDLRKAIAKCKNENPSKEEANQNLMELLDKVMPDVALKLAFVKEFNLSVPIEQQEIDDTVELSKQLEELSAGLAKSDEKIKALEKELEAAKAERDKGREELEKKQKKLAEAKKKAAEKAALEEVSDDSEPASLEIDNMPIAELSDEEAVQRLEELQEQEKKLREELKNRKKERTKEAFTEEDLGEALLKLRCAKILALGNSKHGNFLFDAIRSLAINTFYKIKIAGVKLKFRVGANKFKKGTAAKYKERADEIREKRRVEREAKEAEYQEEIKDLTKKIKSRMEAGELDQDIEQMLEFTKSEINAIVVENDKQKVESKFESEEEFEEYNSRKDSIRQGGEKREQTAKELCNEDKQMLEKARKALRSLKTQKAVVALVEAFPEEFQSSTARKFISEQVRVDENDKITIKGDSSIFLEDLEDAGLIETIRKVKSGPKESNLTAQDMMEILNELSVNRDPDTKESVISFDCLKSEEEKETITPRALEYMQTLVGAESSKIPEDLVTFRRRYQRNQGLLEEAQALTTKEYLEEIQKQIVTMKEKVDATEKKETADLSHKDRQEIRALAVRYVEDSQVIGNKLSEVIKGYSEGEKKAIAKGGRLLEDMAKLADAGKAFSRDSEEIDPQEQSTSPDSHDEP